MYFILLLLPLLYLIISNEIRHRVKHDMVFGFKYCVIPTLQAIISRGGLVLFFNGGLSSMCGCEFMNNITLLLKKLNGNAGAVPKSNFTFNNIKFQFQKNTRHTSNNRHMTITS